MKHLAKPQTQLQEVLYYLIKRIYIDRRQMMLSVGVLNLPEYIRRLRHNEGLTIKLSEVVVENKFGRKVSFGKYSLENKKEAAEVYRRIQSDKS